MTDRNDPASAGETHRRRWKPLFAVAGAVIVAGVAVLYGAGFPGKEGGRRCPGAAIVAAKLQPLVRGEVAALAMRKDPVFAPDLRFLKADGTPTDLAAFRGRTLLVNLWATWCVPCRQEMPDLDRMQDKLGGPDFEVVAVNVDTAKLDRPKAFLRDNAIAHLAFYADPTAGILRTMKEEGGLLGLPTTLLVDRNGCALGVLAGPADWSSADAERLIEAVRG